MNALTYKTFRRIHGIILQSKSLRQAALRLNVGGETLARHLARCSYVDKQGNSRPLSFKLLRLEWPSEKSGFQAWGALYDKPMNIKCANLEQKTLRQIHCVALNSNNLNAAANQLGVEGRTLIRHLGRLNYTDSQGVVRLLSYEALKKEWPSEASGLKAWEASYDKPLNPPLLYLKDKTLREIHRIVLRSSSLSFAAALLGVVDTRLSRYLGRVSYKDGQGKSQPLSFEALKNEWPNEECGLRFWGEEYDKPMKPPLVDLKHKTVREIHRIVLRSSSFTNAAGQLGVDAATLSSHLGKVHYLDRQEKIQALSFEALKNEWPNEECGLSFWGDGYDKPMNTSPVDLQQKSLRDIHRIVLRSDTLSYAASQLGVRCVTLSIHLSKVSYFDAQGERQPLSFKALKNEWPNEASGFYAWGDYYDQPMNTPPVDLQQKTLREIHRIVLSAGTLTSAACLLGVEVTTLRQHLGKVTYVDAQGVKKHLSFKILKKELPGEVCGKEHFGEAYDNLIPPNSESKKRTLQDVSDQYCNYDSLGMDAVADNSASTQCNIDDLNQYPDNGPLGKKTKYCPSFFNDDWHYELPLFPGLDDPISPSSII